MDLGKNKTSPKKPECKKGLKCCRGSVAAVFVTLASLSGAMWVIVMLTEPDSPTRSYERWADSFYSLFSSTEPGSISQPCHLCGQRLRCKHREVIEAGRAEPFVRESHFIPKAGQGGREGASITLSDLCTAVCDFSLILSVLYVLSTSINKWVESTMFLLFPLFTTVSGG